jgi:hypothetical protein
MNGAIKTRRRDQASHRALLPGDARQPHAAARARVQRAGRRDPQERQDAQAEGMSPKVDLEDGHSRLRHT